MGKTSCKKHFLPSEDVQKLCVKIGAKLNDYRQPRQIKELLGKNTPKRNTWINAEYGCNVSIYCLLAILESCQKSLMELAHDISKKGFTEFLIQKDYIIWMEGKWCIGPALTKLLNEFLKK